MVMSLHLCSTIKLDEERRVRGCPAVVDNYRLLVLYYSLAVHRAYYQGIMHDASDGGLRWLCQWCSLSQYIKKACCSNLYQVTRRKVAVKCYCCDAEVRFSPVLASSGNNLNPVQVPFSVLNLKIRQIRKEFR